MTLTNPDSLLDKNGLAYYHSKVKQIISDAINLNVNVTQSAHQTIAYRVFGGHDTEYYPINEVSTYELSGENLFTGSSPFSEHIMVDVFFINEYGYNIGTPIIRLDGVILVGGYSSESQEGDEWDYVISWNSGFGAYIVSIKCPRGSTLDISMTPATLKPTKTVTFKRIQHPNLTLSSSELPSCTLSGNTYQFSQSQDVTFTVPEGTRVHLQANWVTNCYTSCSSSEVTISNSPASASRMDVYFTVNADCEITCSVNHTLTTVYFYTRKKGVGVTHFDGASVSVQYTDPDTNEATSKTADYGSSSSGVGISIPIGTTFNYSYNMPSGWVIDPDYSGSGMSGTNTATSGLKIYAQFKPA